MDLKETDILGSDIDQHWYYSSKAKAMRCLLEGSDYLKILDVGAGSGFFSRHLLAHTGAMEAWCVDISYAADADEREGGKGVYYRRSIDAIDADLVLLMDVLEHVDDDAALLKDYVGKVPRGSRFLLTVPAFQFLWSGHDDFLEHKRRYTLNQLEEVVRNAGLQVSLGAYYFGFVFPLAAMLRCAPRFGTQGKPPRSQLARHNPVVNRLLMSLCRLELPLMRRNRTAGLSIFCLADKV